MKAPGFTLIEILVTLVIVAMFSSAVYGVFLGAVVNTRWVEESVAAARSGHAVLRVIERDLTACAAVTEEVPHFVGSVGTTDSSTLTFITATDSRTHRDGIASDLVTVTYETVPHDEGDGLLRLYRGEEYGAGRTPDEEPESVLLGKNIVSFDLQYHDGAAWLGVWNEPYAPRAVRVEIVLQASLQASARSRARDHEFAFSSVVVIPVGG